MIRRLFWAVFLLLQACTALNPGQPFAEVKTAVKDRTGHSISWDRDSAERTELHSHIKELLSSPITLNDAVEVALLNNPKLQAHYENLGIGQAET